MRPPAPVTVLLDGAHPAVEVRDEGRQRLYRIDGRPLQPIHAWVSRYAATWEGRFARLDDVLAELAEEEARHPENGAQP